jgi:hypothetical protein
MTTLVGTLTDPILKLDNNGTGPALQLDVGSGNAPLVVNTDAGTATGLSADKLDGKEPNELPGTIASTHTFHDYPGNPFQLGGLTGQTTGLTPKFVGNPATGITTTSSQRLVGAGEVPLGDTNAPTTINVDLCYQPSGGGTLTPFNGGSAGVLNSDDQFWTATSSVVPGAGTWNVGLCVTPAVGGRDADRVSYTSGWVQVVNQ